MWAESHDVVVHEEKVEEQKVTIIENEKHVMGDRGGLVIHNITIQPTSDWVLLATRCVMSLAFDAHGNYLALGLFDGQVDILGVRDAVLRIRTIPRPPEQRWVNNNNETVHYHPGSANSLSWSFDCQYLVVSHLAQKEQAVVGKLNCSTAVLWEVGAMANVSTPLATVTCSSVIANVSVGSSNPLSFIACGKCGTAWLYVEKEGRQNCTRQKETENDDKELPFFEHRVLCSERPADESTNQFFTVAAAWLPDNRMAFVAYSSGVIVKVDTVTSEVKTRCELPWAASPWTMQVLHSQGKLAIAGKGVILLPLETLSFEDAIVMGESIGRSQGVSKYKGYWGAAAVGNITGQKHDNNLAVIASSASPMTQSSLFTWFIVLGEEDNSKMSKMGGNSSIGCEKWEGQQFEQIDVHETPNKEAIIVIRIHPNRPMVLAVTAEGNALARIPNMYSDFAGPMYPSGYRMTSNNVDYVEPEDELDYTVIKTGNQWTKVPVHEVVTRGPNEVVLEEESSDPQSFCDPDEFVGLFADSEQESYCCIMPDLSSLHHVGDRVNNDLQCTAEMFKRRKPSNAVAPAAAAVTTTMTTKATTEQPKGDGLTAIPPPSPDESRESCPFPPLPLPVPLEVLNGSLLHKFGSPEKKLAAKNELRIAGMAQYLEKEAEMEKKSKALIEKRQAKIATRKEAKEAEMRAAAKEMKHQAEAHAEALKKVKIETNVKPMLPTYFSMDNHHEVTMNNINDQVLQSEAVRVHLPTSNAPEKLPLQEHLNIVEKWKLDRISAAVASASQSANNNCSSQKYCQIKTNPPMQLVSPAVASGATKIAELFSQDLMAAVKHYNEHPKILDEIFSVQEQDVIAEVPQSHHQQGSSQKLLLQSQQDIPQEWVLQSQQGLPQKLLFQSQQGLPQQQSLPQELILQSQQGLPQQRVLQSQQGLPQQQGLSQQPVLQSQQGLSQQPVLQSQQGLSQQLVLQSQQGLPQQPVLQSQQGLPQQQGLSQQPVLQSQQGLPQKLVLQLQQGLPQQLALQTQRDSQSLQDLPQRPVMQPQQGCPSSQS